ncbi:secreted protein, partial [methanotrophic bacterial endosymbiont of Bathymodiolus sp.]
MKQSKLKLIPLIFMMALSGQVQAGNFNKVLNDWKAKLKAEAAAEVARRAQVMIPELEVKSPVAAIEWVTDQATF